MWRFGVPGFSTCQSYNIISMFIPLDLSEKIYIRQCFITFSNMSKLVIDKGTMLPVCRIVLTVLSYTDHGTPTPAIKLI